MLVLFLLDLLFKGNIPLCKWLGLSFDRVFKSHAPETSHTSQKANSPMLDAFSLSLPARSLALLLNPSAFSLHSQLNRGLDVMEDNLGVIFQPWQLHDSMTESKYIAHFFSQNTIEVLCLHMYCSLH